MQTITPLERTIRDSNRANSKDTSVSGTLKALVVDPVDKHLIEELRRRDVEVNYSPGMSRERIMEEIGDYEIIIGRTRMPIDSEMINQGTKLRIIGRAGVGIENIDVDEAISRGIKVVNAPDSATESVAELALALIISSLREVYLGASRLKSGTFKKNSGFELAGKTVGIIGFGRIGSRVAEVLKPFGVNVLACDLVDVRERAACTGAEQVELSELLERSDIISVHVNMEVNKGPVLNREEFARMKDSVILINTARGHAINMDALYESLENGTVGHYAADVLWNEPPKDPKELSIIDRENVVITPHIGAQTEEAQERVAKRIAGNLIEEIAELRRA